MWSLVFGLWSLLVFNSSHWIHIKFSATAHDSYYRWNETHSCWSIQKSCLNLDYIFDIWSWQSYTMSAGCSFYSEVEGVIIPGKYHKNMYSRWNAHPPPRGNHLLHWPQVTRLPIAILINHGLWSLTSSLTFLANTINAPSVGCPITVSPSTFALLHTQPTWKGGGLKLVIAWIPYTHLFFNCCDHFFYISHFDP